MRVNIAPILSADVEKATQAFFTPEFASQWLGQPGQWLGVESQRLGLKGPVDKPVLDHLLLGRSPAGTVQPRGDWRPADQPAGWKVTFDLDWRHNTLWAAGNEEIRHLAEFTHGTVDGEPDFVRGLRGQLVEHECRQQTDNPERGRQGGPRQSNLSVIPGPKDRSSAQEPTQFFILGRCHGVTLQNVGT